MQIQVLQFHHLIQLYFSKLCLQQLHWNPGRPLTHSEITSEGRWSRWRWQISKEDQKSQNSCRRLCRRQKDWWTWGSGETEKESHRGTCNYKQRWRLCAEHSYRRSLLCPTMLHRARRIYEPRTSLQVEFYYPIFWSDARNFLTNKIILGIVFLQP